MSRCGRMIWRWSRWSRGWPGGHLWNITGRMCRVHRQPQELTRDRNDGPSLPARRLAAAQFLAIEGAKVNYRKFTIAGFDAILARERGSIIKCTAVATETRFTSHDWQADAAGQAYRHEFVAGGDGQNLLRQVVAHRRERRRTCQTTNHRPAWQILTL